MYLPCPMSGGFQNLGISIIHCEAGDFRFQNLPTRILDSHQPGYGSSRLERRRYYEMERIFG
jgi:hypothetical protein